MSQQPSLTRFDVELIAAEHDHAWLLVGIIVMVKRVKALIGMYTAIVVYNIHEQLISIRSWPSIEYIMWQSTNKPAKIK